MSRADTSSPALAIDSLTKSFGANIALSASGFTLRKGEIHVLVGENGSGKSTMIKVLSGYHVPDSGTVTVNDVPLTFGSPEYSYRHGLRFVHQDLGLIATASVLDNLAMGAGYPTRIATIRGRAARADARRALHSIGLDVDPDAKVGELPAAQRTGVAVARALREDQDHPVTVLVLDEPTATLPADEVDNLLAMLRVASSSGLAVLFITHHLDEVFRIADRVSVLRDGRLVVTSDIASVDRPQLVDWLVGDDFQEVDPDAVADLAAANVPPVLKVRELSAGALVDFSFEVSPGEIVGIAGLTGSGRESVLGAIFGSTPRDAGTVELRGSPVRVGRPDLAIAAGVGFMPADRKTQGGYMTLTARENLTAASLTSFSSPVRIDKRKETSETASWFERLRVRPARSYSQLLSSFSGGNQQKILFGKWLRLPLAVFLLDEPTQGVDIGSKAELHRQLLDFAQRDVAVVVSSTDVEELAAICTRVIVIRAGRVSTELTGRQITVATVKNSIMSELAS